jgi:hypothetical protein
MPQESQPDAP